MTYTPPENFVKMGGSGDSWKYKDEGKGAVFFGIFQSKQEDVGENHSNVYTFNRYDSDKFEHSLGYTDIWGSSLLDIRLSNIQLGEQVIIIYLGEEKSEKRKGKSYHNFEIYHEMPKPKAKEDVAGEESQVPDVNLEDLEFDLDNVPEDLAKAKKK